MKAQLRNFIRICLFLVLPTLAGGVASAQDADAEKRPLPVQPGRMETPASIGEDEDVEEVAGIEPTARKKAVTPPTVLDVKRSIAELEPDGVTIFTRVFNIDRSAGISELFQRCRAVDKAVKETGKCGRTKRIEQLYASRKYKKKHGVKRLRGTYFEIVGPQRVTWLEKARRVRRSFVPDMKTILAAADAAFEHATKGVRMSLFMNWAVVQGRIYVVIDPEEWRKLGTTGLRSQPVQTVMTESRTREFYVYAGEKIHDYADQAIGYAVAKLVYEEYAKIISGKPDAHFPLFFITGLAAEAGKLEAVITVNGPVQVAEVKLPSKTIKVRRPKKGKKLPLRKNRLIPLENLITDTKYPNRNEGIYYFLRESTALVEALQTQAPLSFISLCRALASGKDFKKEIGMSYMEMQRDVEQREVKRPKKRKKTKKGREGKEDEEQQPVFPDYQRFAKYMDKVLYTLTEEHIIAQWKKKKLASRSKKAAEQAAAPKAEQ